MSRVLIIGIGGFSGIHFQKFVQSKKLYKKYDFFGVGLKEDCLSQFVNYKRIDFTDQKNVKKFLLEFKPRYIINLCGNYSSTKFEKMKSLNFIVTKHIIDIILNENVSIKKLLLIGSAAEYGNITSLPIKENSLLNPLSDYGITKKMQTDYAVNSFKIGNLPVVIARTFNLYGSGISEDLIYGKYLNIINKAKDGSIIELYNSNYIRDFIDVEHAIEIYWLLLIYGTPGEIYNVCSGKGKSIKDLVELMVKNSGKKIKIVSRDKKDMAKEIVKSVGDNNKINNLISKFQCL